MLEGEKVYLDTIEENDLEQLRYWRNLSYYKKHFREYREINQSMQKDGLKTRFVMMTAPLCLLFGILRPRSF